MSARPTLICPKDGQTHEPFRFDGEDLALGGDNEGELDDVTEAVFRAWWFNAAEIEVSVNIYDVVTDDNYSGTVTYRRCNHEVAGLAAGEREAWTNTYPAPSIIDLGNESFKLTGGSAGILWTPTSVAGDMATAERLAAGYCPIPQLMARPKDGLYRASLRRYVAYWVPGSGIQFKNFIYASDVSTSSLSLDSTSADLDVNLSSGDTSELSLSITSTFFTP